MEVPGLQTTGSSRGARGQRRRLVRNGAASAHPLCSTSAVGATRRISKGQNKPPGTLASHGSGSHRARTPGAQRLALCWRARRRPPRTPPSSPRPTCCWIGHPRSSTPTPPTSMPRSPTASRRGRSTASASTIGGWKAWRPGCAGLAALPDPIGEVSTVTRRPNGLDIQRVRVPLGVVAIIYENRPNVTSDAAGLCLKSGNAALLRGSATALRFEPRRSRRVLRDGVGEGTACPTTSCCSSRTPTHETAVDVMQLTDYVDCLIPRGGPSLIQSVLDNAHGPGDHRRRWQLPRVRRRGRRPRRWRSRSSSTPRRSGRACATPPSRWSCTRESPTRSFPGPADARRRRGRARRRRRARAVAPSHRRRDRRRLRARVPRPRDDGRRSPPISTARSPTSTATAPGTPRRSSPATSRPPGASPTRSTRRWSS